MKMTKKFMIAAAIAALLVGFTACNNEYGDINWDEKQSPGGTKTFKVEQTNNGKNTIRGLKQFDLIPRAGATCIVQLFNQNESSRDGMVGFATYVTENKTEGTINFLVVGVTSNGGKTETYASYFCNVDPEKLSTENFGVSAKKKAFDEDVTTPYEIELLEYPTIIKGKYDKDGTLKVAIDFSAKNTGDIDISWYDAPELKSGDKASATFDLSKCTRLAPTITALASVIGKTKTTKNGYMYAYSNIYAGKSVKAQWDLYNVTLVKDARYAEEAPTFLPTQVGDIFFEEF